MNIEHDLVTASAQLKLRALKDILESHISLVLRCESPEEMTVILHGLSDTCKEYGRGLEKLATRSHGSIAPQETLPTTIELLPSTIPPSEEPEEESYLAFGAESSSRIRKSNPTLEE